MTRRARYAVYPVGLCLLAACAAAAQDTPLVTVDGVPIMRSAALQRAWQEDGANVLNEMADDILISREAARLDVTPDEKEVEMRLERIRGQFPDEATFAAKLKASGTSPQQLKAQIEEQVLREDLVEKGAGIKVTDAEVRAYYDANKDRPGAPEAVHLRHILVATEKQADDFAVAVKAGADFAKLAADASLDTATKDKGGDLGWISRGLVIPEIEKAAFAMKPGDVQVVRTQLGWHLLRVDAVRPAQPAAFGSVEKQIRATLLADKISKAWPGYLQSLRAKAKYVNAAAAPRAAAAGKP